MFAKISKSKGSDVIFSAVTTRSRQRVGLACPTFMQSELPGCPEPTIRHVSGLAPSIIISRSSLKKGTHSAMKAVDKLCTDLQLLFSEVKRPFIKATSCFSFGSPGKVYGAYSNLKGIAGISVRTILSQGGS